MRIPNGRTRRIGLSAAILCLAAGCEPTAPTAERVAINIEAATTASVTFTVHNTTAGPIFLWRCGDHVQPDVERRVGNEWVNAAAAICPAVYSSTPNPLDAGAVLRDSAFVPGAGVYRLRIATFAGIPSADTTSKLVRLEPAASVTSPSFSVK